MSYRYPSKDLAHATASNTFFRLATMALLLLRLLACCVLLIRQALAFHSLAPLRISLALHAAPPLNGQRVWPTQILQKGLSGDASSSVVYALHTDPQGDWKSCVGVTVDRNKLNDAPYVRAQTCVSLSELQVVATEWKQKAVEAGATLELEDAADVLDYLFEDEDDEDDDDDEWEEEMTQAAVASMAVKEEAPIVSPFVETTTTTTPATIDTKAMTVESVNKVLDEVRPYLISDGGNVAVVSVEPPKVALRLEGACGSCASSTVTMQMGIERVLKEAWPEVQVESVQPQVTELTREAVEEEVNRLRPAITAMGGVVEVVDVDPELKSVKLRYKGANKVRQGLELAIRDLPLVQHVEFVSES